MIIKITPDKERAKSILKMTEERETFLKMIKENHAPVTMVVENYYEIVKELITAILLTEGIKTVGENAHKELIENLAGYKQLDESEIHLLDDLRIRRNKSSYEGKQIEMSFLENHEGKIIDISKRLKVLLKSRILK